jgi:hypothetical protein
MYYDGLDHYVGVLTQRDYVRYDIPTTKGDRVKLKEALVKDGFLKADQVGRGRPSKAMLARATELVAAGWNIDGFSKSTVVDASAGDKTTDVIEHKPTVSVGKQIADIGPPRYDPRDYEAYVLENGKPVVIGIKAVCDICRNSITYCPCPTSYVMRNGHQVPVTVKPVQTRR